jgi:1,4-alpha-glucan branching enzyme
VWLNGTNDWIYPYLHAAAEKMSALVQRFPNAEGRLRWALDQAARELLLAQSSDWAFIMKTGTSVDYAVRRFKTHLHRFHRLTGMAESNNYDEAYLREISARDSLFPDMDYRIFQARPW